MKAAGFASVLAYALSEAQSFTDRSQSIEAIRNVLIECKGNRLRVTGMNLATGFTTSVEEEVGEGGRMVESPTSSRPVRAASVWSQTEQRFRSKRRASRLLQKHGCWRASRDALAIQPHRRREG